MAATAAELETSGPAPRNVDMKLDYTSASDTESLQGNLGSEDQELCKGNSSAVETHVCLMLSARSKMPYGNWLKELFTNATDMRQIIKPYMFSKSRC